MKEHGILFSAPMVRALLAGIKTQTRRTMKPQPPAAAATPSLHDAQAHAGIEHGRPAFKCPYGKDGDLLWVKETWADLAGTGIEYRNEAGKLQRYAYAADALPGSVLQEIRDRYALKWRSPIFMPRRASRLTLVIESVRIERLQAITQSDAKAEGVDPGTLDYRSAYQLLWENINGKGSWDENPWVWMVQFRLCHLAAGTVLA